jgi:hypothetical protein
MSCPVDAETPIAGGLGPTGQLPAFPSVTSDYFINFKNGFAGKLPSWMFPDTPSA